MLYTPICISVQFTFTPADIAWVYQSFMVPHSLAGKNRGSLKPNGSPVPETDKAALSLLFVSSHST